MDSFIYKLIVLPRTLPLALYVRGEGVGRGGWRIQVLLTVVVRSLATRPREDGTGAGAGAEGIEE